MNELYNSFNSFLRKKFNNQKVVKIPINAGFNCPNKDGKFSEDGCIFCDTFGSGPIKSFNLSVEDQIKEFIKRHPGHKYIAYFQAHTNTYASVKDLKVKFEIIFDFKDIVGLFIGTRPDSIADDVHQLLKDLNRKTYLSVELGLQSVHSKSLKYLNRNHTYEDFLNTFKRLKDNGIDVIAHLIVGIPGENRSDMFETVNEMNRIKPAGIKFHLFHILKDTTLFKMYMRKKFSLLEKDDYIDLVISLLEKLDPEIVIHRITGERDKEIFFAPMWALNKMDVINSIKSRMGELRTFQGKSFVV